MQIDEMPTMRPAEKAPTPSSRIVLSGEGTGGAPGQAAHAGHAAHAAHPGHGGAAGQAGGGSHRAPASSSDWAIHRATSGRMAFRVVCMRGSVSPERPGSQMLRGRGAAKQGGSQRVLGRSARRGEATSSSKPLSPAA